MGNTERTAGMDPQERWVKVAALAFAAIEDYEKGRITDLEPGINTADELEGMIDGLL